MTYSQWQKNSLQPVLSNCPFSLRMTGTAWRLMIAVSVWTITIHIVGLIIQDNSVWLIKSPGAAWHAFVYSHVWMHLWLCQLKYYPKSCVNIHNTCTRIKYTKTAVEFFFFFTTVTPFVVRTALKWVYYLFTPFKLFYTNCSLLLHACHQCGVESISCSVMQFKLDFGLRWIKYLSSNSSNRISLLATSPICMFMCIY